MDYISLRERKGPVHQVSKQEIELSYPHSTCSVCLMTLHIVLTSFLSCSFSTHYTNSFSSQIEREVTSRSGSRWTLVTLFRFQFQSESPKLTYAPEGFYVKLTQENNVGDPFTLTKVLITNKTYKVGSKGSMNPYQFSTKD